MFEAARISPVAYEAPWGADLDARIAALAARPRHVAYFYDFPDTSTFRYRAFNMIQALNSEVDGDTSASWFYRGDLDKMERFVDRADALVLCRVRYTPAIARLVARANARGVPVLFDVDDLVFDPDYVHLLMDTLDQNASDEIALDTWFGMVSRYGAVLRMCDRAIVTNPFLARRVEAYVPHIETSIIPNFLNAEQQALSARLFEAKRQTGFVSNGPVHVGYFSGTPTHNRDFAVVTSALARLLSDNPQVVLRVVGFLEPKGALVPHRDRIETYPLQDFLNLQRLIAEVEINIAPLQDNLFTNCKSELKYFEAAITGTITVASPTYTFSRAIVDGGNSFLAAAYEWNAKLEAALGLVRQPSRYAEMAEEGFRHAEQTYGWDRYGALIEQTIFGAEAGKYTNAFSAEQQPEAASAFG